MSGQVKVMYQADNEDNTYVTMVPLQPNLPFPRALKVALTEASTFLLHSLARDIRPE